MTTNKYGNPIWTNHALDRLIERGLTKDKAIFVFNNPDNVFKGKNNSLEYQKKIGKYMITLIAKKNTLDEWVIISCWMDPHCPEQKMQDKRHGMLNTGKLDY